MLQSPSWYQPVRATQALFLTLMAFLATVPVPALAQSTPDLGQMFANFNQSSVALIQMLVWVAFVMGLFISGLGVLRFKDLAESNGRVKPITPVVLVCVGAALCAVPGFVGVATETLDLGRNSGTILSEPNVSDIPGFNDAIKGILMFIKLIGHIAFIRGLLIMKRVGEGDQQAGFFRGVTHLLGGAAAININATIGILGATFAPGFLDGTGLGINPFP